MKNKIYHNCMIAFPFLILLFFLYHAHIFIPTKMLPPCFFHYVTGFSCPGCGCTRAAQALLGGHVWQSVTYHPIILYVVILYTYYILSHTAERTVNLAQKKLPSAFREGSPLCILTRIKGMRHRNIYLYAGIFILLTFFIVRLIVEIVEHLA